jgi:hypothetical protein
MRVPFALDVGCDDDKKDTITEKRNVTTNQERRIQNQTY